MPQITQIRTDFFHGLQKKSVCTNLRKFAKSAAKKGYCVFIKQFVIYNFLICNIMKKIILFAFTATLILSACSPKGSAKATAANTVPGDVQLTAALTKFPDATLDVLKKGHSIYNGACTNCHGAKNIVKRGETEWVKILDRMALKAKLSADEKDAVWKYIMSVKLSAPTQ